MANRDFEVQLSSGDGGESVCGVRSRLIQTLILNRKNQFVLVELTLPAILLFYFFFFFFQIQWPRNRVYVVVVTVRASLRVFPLLYLQTETSTLRPKQHIVPARDPRISSGKWLQPMWYLLRRKNSDKPISYNFWFSSPKKNQFVLV